MAVTFMVGIEMDSYDIAEDTGPLEVNRLELRLSTLCPITGFGERRPCQTYRRIIPSGTLGQSRQRRLNAQRLQGLNDGVADGRIDSRRTEADASRPFSVLQSQTTVR